MIKIALFASGSGTNVENIYKYFNNSEKIKVVKVYCNKPNAGVLDRCRRLGLNHLVFTKEEFYESETVLNDLKNNVDAIILAGFLWKVPSNLIEAFPSKIINIHPALLPTYGGKGMYGMSVHKAVKENNESKTGITIHLVNENYDEGAILYQATTLVKSDDSVEDIAHKVHLLEYEYFPKIVEKTLLKHG